MPHRALGTLEKWWLKRNKVFDKEDELLFSLLAAIVKPNTAMAHKKCMAKTISGYRGLLAYVFMHTLHFDQWARSRAGNVRGRITIIDKPQDLLA